MIKLRLYLHDLNRISKARFFENCHFFSECSIVEGRGKSHSEQIMAQLPTVLGEKLERLLCSMSV